MSKGGSSNTRTPVESPDSLQSTSYAKLLFALGEGEWEGGLDGTNIFLDGTPIKNPDGSINFPGVQYEFRSGTPDQTHIPGIPDIENETAIGLELTSQTPFVRAVTNTQLSAVRFRFSWSALQRQLDDGDVVGYRIEYAVDVATDGGAYQQVLTSAVDGKTTTKYERSHRIDLPDATTGWQIRIRRITANSTSNMIADKMVIDAITEVIDAKLRYPETALLFIQFDASQFQNIPVVSSEPKMRIVRIPSNYDSATRSYSGIWDGSFKWAWTDNPAWIYYDVLVSDRFGLGQRIKAANLYYTKLDLYQIAQYCDQLVPDGRGGNGTEPRFTCNIYIQAQAEAWTLINDMGAIFRGMTFWANNQMNVLADMPRDMDYAITRANVKDGKFTYSSASEKTHYSHAFVSWSDPANGYQDAIEPVSEIALVRRFGVKQADVTAIGCTRQTEAIRRGKWVLHTNDADRSVSFTVGLDGKIPLPGYIVGIADEMVAGRPLGGRISKVNGRNITLDRVSSAAVGERLIVNLPNGKAEGRTIQTVAGKVITVTTAFSVTPVPQSVWAIDASDLALQLFRVTGITEGSDGVSYDITAIEYDPNKFDRIDTGARIEDRPISVIPPGVQPPPTNVVIDSFSALSQGLAVTTLRVTWEPAASAIAYEAEWRRDNGNWISAPRTSAQGFQVEGIYAGQYQARVRAINPSEISSIWANAQETTLKGKEGNPPMPVGFAATGIIFGITLSWGYPEGAEDALKTEIEYSLSADGTDAMLLSDVPHPQRNYTMQGLRAGQVFWFRARIVDKSGNQSPWIDWFRGMSSTDTSSILEFVGDEFITNTVAGQQLLNDDFMNAEAILETANANNASIRQQWAHYGENKAGIVEIWTTQADAARAFAEYQLVVTATFEDQTAAIGQKMTAVVDADSAIATYSLGAGLNYNGQFVSAGMVIGAEFINGVAKASIGFNADSFILLSGPEDNKFSPWAVVNGQTFINDGFIQNGSITNAKIGQYIMSDNYVMGMLGWKIDKLGNAEFNNVTVRGTVYATAGKFSGTIESNDGYFGGTVYANKIIGDVVQGVHLKGYVTNTGMSAGASADRVPSGVLWTVFSFDSANFERVLIINGDVTWGNIYSGNDLNLLINGVVVQSFITGGASTPATTVGGVSFRVPATVLGGMDVVSIRYNNFGGGSSNVTPLFNATVLVCKKGSAGVLVGPNNIPA
ncbi:TipJ family phage tail tip protein [Yersinia frederiksenii]|uniref:TipJ family phage tail tip protein n=1 Tax=Yersinia frederiksenii TaxID=29484 RepID=UPI0005E25F84|nr:putative phage host specificity protein [Yersinia frederiksenii]